VKVKGVSIVHFQWAHVPILEYLTIKVLKVQGISVFFTAHNAFPHEFKPIHVKQYCRIYNTVDKIVVLTKFVANEIQVQCKTAKDKITVIPHGNYAPITDSLDIDNTFNITGHPIIGFLGLIRPYKGLLHLIHAFSVVNSKLPDSRLLIIGRCLEDYNNYQIAIDNLGLSQKIITILKYVPMKEFVGLLNLIDIVVFPNITASQSGSIPLLYQYSKPVVATKVGGLPEMVAHGKSGYLVKPNSDNDLAYAILDILQSPEQLKKMKLLAKSFGESRFSWNTLIPQFLKIYKGFD
jgi:glycosyltransferase involved in cell wall biosynthesis